MEATLQRKLTTILAADVAGYSRLMGNDEEGTHRRFAALQGGRSSRTAIGARGGTLVKQTGDGFLAEFASVVEAVRCGGEIQRRRRRAQRPACRPSGALLFGSASTSATSSSKAATSSATGSMSHPASKPWPSPAAS